jgi:hypothetical protein
MILANSEKDKDEVAEKGEVDEDEDDDEDEEDDEEEEGEEEGDDSASFFLAFSRGDLSSFLICLTLMRSGS